MTEDVIAVILAAGDSGRLWPVKDKLNLYFGNITLLNHSVRQLKKAGISRFIIVTGKKNRQNIQSLIPEKNAGISLNLIVQENNLGMAGAILAAKNLIKDNKIIVVGPSDIVEDYLFSDFNRLLAGDPEGIFVGKKLDSYSPLGFYDIDAGTIAGVREKPGPSKAKGKPAAIILDYYRDSNKLLTAISAVRSTTDDIYEKAKDILVRDGLVIKLLNYNGYWGYIKYPWHILEVASYFLNKFPDKKNEAALHETVTIRGPVFIEDNVTILENVKILGPVFIGKSSLIGQNCLIRESVIGEGNIIGFGSEITRSYLGSNCWFHQNYIGDSVVLDNTSFGSGAVIANYRLDGGNIISEVEGKKIDTNRTKLGAVVGRNVRIGVNSSVMPGVKIGENSFVGSGVVLNSDLPENKYIEVRKDSYRVLNNKVNLKTGAMDKNLGNLKF